MSVPMEGMSYSRWTFILNRINDNARHSTKWIVGYALLFWIVTRIAVAVIISICGAVYDMQGINPSELTKFGGDPSAAMNSSSPVFSLLMVLILAPLFEELVFRLGLSFKRWQVATGVAAICLFPAWSHLHTTSLTGWIISAAPADYI